MILFLLNLEFCLLDLEFDSYYGCLVRFLLWMFGETKLIFLYRIAKKSHDVRRAMLLDEYVGKFICISIFLKKEKEKNRKSCIFNWQNQIMKGLYIATVTNTIDNWQWLHITSVPISFQLPQTPAIQTYSPNTNKLTLLLLHHPILT